MRGSAAGWALVVLGIALGGCSRSQTGSATAADRAADETPPSPAPADVAAAEPVEPADDVPPGCAETRVGLDLRALPVGSSVSAIDMFVAAHIDELRNLAPPGVTTEFYVQTGISSFRAVFRAPTDPGALEACQATIDAWLPDAPRLPVIMESAASADPCRPCEAAN